MAKLSFIYAAWSHNAEEMAADIDEKPVTVRQWRHRGSIPPRYWKKIIERAAQRGHSLNWEQFVELVAT